MKRFLIIIIAISSFYLTSCNKIEEPYTLPVPTKDWYGKKILLEDYTGHKCQNCPSAALIAANIKEQYGEKVIVLAVHAGSFAKPTPPNYPEDFRTVAGDAWNDFFGISLAGNPNGLVNRKGYPGLHIIAPGEWASKIGNALAEIPEVGITVKNTYNPADSSVSGKIDFKFLKTIKKKLKYQILISEDSIIAPQLNATTIIPNYLHRHMLRASVNGPWGNDLTDGNTFNLIDSEISKSFAYSLKATDLINYKIKDCSVIVFVYDDATKEILQTEEVHIK